MLETWEAGLKFLETTVGVSSIKAIEKHGGPNGNRTQSP